MSASQPAYRYLFYSFYPLQIQYCTWILSVISFQQFSVAFPFSLIQAQRMTTQASNIYVKHSRNFVPIYWWATIYSKRYEVGAEISPLTSDNYLLVYWYNIWGTKEGEGLISMPFFLVLLCSLVSANKRFEKGILPFFSYILLSLSVRSRLSFHFPLFLYWMVCTLS